MLEKLKAMPPKKLAGYLTAVIIAAVIVCIYLSMVGGSGNKEMAQANVPDIEVRMEEALSRMEGVGEVSVVINYESTSELVPAKQSESLGETTESSSGSSVTEKLSENLAMVSGEALIVKENQPRVRGVIVIAEGARDMGVRNDLLNAVTTLLDVTADRVEILY